MAKTPAVQPPPISLAEIIEMASPGFTEWLRREEQLKRDRAACEAQTSEDLLALVDLYCDHHAEPYDIHTVIIVLQERGVDVGF
jgi:hypothetical protein